MFGFLFGSRIGQFISIAILVSGAFFGWLAVHDHNLWNEATNKFNEMQQQLLEKKQEEFQKQTEVISNNADQIKQDLSKQNNDAKKQLIEIERQALKETKSDKPVNDDASPYLKSIVKQLNAAYGEKKK